MDALERGDSGAEALSAVRRTLGRIELDAFAPQLGTRQFQTPEYGQVRATPCRFEDWWVLWRVGATEGTLEIIMVCELPV